MKGNSFWKDFLGQKPAKTSFTNTSFCRFWTFFEKKIGLEKNFVGMNFEFFWKPYFFEFFLEECWKNILFKFFLEKKNYWKFVKKIYLKFWKKIYIFWEKIFWKIFFEKKICKKIFFVIFLYKNFCWNFFEKLIFLKKIFLKFLWKKTVFWQEFFGPKNQPKKSFTNTFLWRIWNFFEKN